MKYFKAPTHNAPTMSNSCVCSSGTHIQPFSHLHYHPPGRSPFATGLLKIKIHCFHMVKFCCTTTTANNKSAPASVCLLLSPSILVWAHRTASLYLSFSFQFAFNINKCINYCTISSSYLQNDMRFTGWQASTYPYIQRDLNSTKTELFQWCTQPSTLQNAVCPHCKQLLPG